MKLRACISVLVLAGCALGQQEINGYRTLDNVAAPATPASGKTVLYIDSTLKQLCTKDDAGNVNCLTLPPGTIVNSTNITFPGTVAVGATCPGGTPAGSVCFAGELLGLGTGATKIGPNTTSLIANLPGNSNCAAYAAGLNPAPISGYCTPVNNQYIEVSDATGPCDATVGGSNVRHQVYYNGSAYVSADPICTATALPNGTTATTQSAADNSTKVATTAYADAAAGARQAALTNPVTGPGSGATSGHGAKCTNTACTTIDDIGYVPVNPSSISNVTNDAQTKAAVYPNAPTTGSLSSSCSGTVNWAVGSVLSADTALTTTGSCNLTVSGMLATGVYVVYVTQGSGGSYTLSLGTGGTGGCAAWKVRGGGSGAVTLTSTAGAVDILIFKWDGSTCWAVLGTNWN